MAITIIDAPPIASDSGLVIDLPIFPAGAFGIGTNYTSQIQGRLVVSDDQVIAVTPWSALPAEATDEIDDFWAAAELTTAPWTPDTDEERLERRELLATIYPLQAQAISELDL